MDLFESLIMFVHERFVLDTTGENEIRRIQPQFGFDGFGEFCYMRTYSRLIRDQNGVAVKQENWHDTCIRVINGTMSIRKDHYARNRIKWDETYWQRYAAGMGVSLARMEWLPPGRGLWAMGSQHVYERGAMPLINCAYTDINKDWVDDLCWGMDCLMCGVGVGFGPKRNGLKLKTPIVKSHYVIPDTREGWVESVRLLLTGFRDGTSLPTFDYSKIRPKGAPIVTFGGIASGPAPLIRLHELIIQRCNMYIDGQLDEVCLKADLANMIGVCVVSGNVRRGAEILCGDAEDEVFVKLKDYKAYPDRAEWGWMSNNSLILSKPEHFELMGDIAYANIRGCDVGFINRMNMPYGRIGKDDGLREDKAVAFNPCGEQPLEHREVCTLAETCPTRCISADRWLLACEYATCYASTVTLLPTHQPSTNAVILRNRRIGVSIIDFTGWKEEEELSVVIRHLRDGYKRVRETNRFLAEEAGIPESIRVTTVKPGGTVPKLPGKSPGASHPTSTYTLRRANVGKGTALERFLIENRVPHEDSVYTPDTTVFEFPIVQGPAAPAGEISIWEQAFNVVLLQREWSDNAVSNTLYFRPQYELIADVSYEVALEVYGYDPGKAYFFRDGMPDIGDNRYVKPYAPGRVYVYTRNADHEEDQLSAVLAHIAPLVKSISLLPHSDKGIFAQMPEEGLSRDEFLKRKEAMPVIDWSTYFGSDGEDERFCTGEKCELTVVPEQLVMPGN